MNQDEQLSALCDEIAELVRKRMTPESKEVIPLACSFVLPGTGVKFLTNMDISSAVNVYEATAKAIRRQTR